MLSWQPASQGAKEIAVGQMESPRKLICQRRDRRTLAASKTEMESAIRTHTQADNSIHGFKVIFRGWDIVSHQDDPKRDLKTINIVHVYVNIQRQIIYFSYCSMNKYLYKTQILIRISIITF